jgi:E3 ubiquitin ligase
MISTQWHASLNHDEITFLLVAACVLGLIFFISFFYYLKRARLIEDTPTSRIRSAAQGYVELVGAVSADDTGGLVTPLSGTPCVWYDFKVQRYRSSGKNSHWHTIKKGTSEQWFQIDDRTGVCIIDPQGAEVLTEHSRTWYGNSESPTQQGNKRNGLLQNIRGRRYRYIEKFIYVHDVIYALGHFQSQGGGRNVPSNHQMTGKIIQEWRQDYNKILQQFDQDGNREIDLKEWEQVRKIANEEAEQRRSDISLRSTVHILSKAPNKQYPFILSTHSQKKLTKRFRSYSALAFLGIIICNYIVITFPY